MVHVIDVPPLHVDPDDDDDRPDDCVYLPNLKTSIFNIIQRNDFLVLKTAMF